MNELIQKFAEQADLFADSKLLMKGEYHPDWHDIRDEKFAELIVEEVLDVINRERFEIYPPVLQRVRKHFGIDR
jgi:BMFP domain-containing protein YqiC